MKQIFVSIMVLFSSLHFAAATCERAEKAMDVVEALEKYESPSLESPILVDEIKEIKEAYKADKLCANDMLTYLKHMGFCTSLTVESALFPNQPNTIVAKDPRHQAQLESALLAYGELFPDEEEAQGGFACELKGLKFTALEN